MFKYISYVYYYSMNQLELFPLNFDKNLEKKIKYMLRRIRHEERMIYRREKAMHRTLRNLSALKMTTSDGLISLCSVRKKEKLMRVLKLEERLIDVTWKLYIDSCRRLGGLYYQIKSNLRLVPQQHIN